MSGGSTALVLPRGAVPKRCWGSGSSPTLWLRDTSQLWADLLWLLVSSYGLSQLLTWHYRYTKQTTNVRNQYCQFSVNSLCYCIWCSIPTKSAAQEVSQWKYVMNYCMQCMLQQYKFVLVKGWGVCYTCSKTVFYSKTPFALQYRGQKEKNWRLNVSLYQFNRASAETVVLAAVVIVQTYPWNEW